MTAPGPRQKRPSRGRPVATTHAEIEQAAFRLFAERGFEATTLEDIAREVGVSRRTLFGYFDSKNDIPWGQFDRTLESFRALLEAMPEDLPLHEAVFQGIVGFNEFPGDAEPPHLDRMRLILQTPALQAHSVLRYREWRQVISEYVARRLAVDPGDLLPQTVGHVSLALALTAYERWLSDPDSTVPQLLAETREALGDFLERF
ncbi:mycofactocin system transcriptional regulator [Nocardioides sp. cx-173]|uniref:mycofactocin system transcriptional regulator n=1 Tax=Nocardioides sp. cx-173 TaxID=2898796 RepID=UPI001E4340E1|nr:mycofactocin system transcriptional regulator [Nocardioides sp. cx-173]MCD4523579.1 mycofactocin system transcriptional regulator [Nocardioides sp. cx-173]UGB42085.1 mycofactocin system transcriptional regulator [Nocardioides sp. cx-173]